jgi:hypothetical protein
MSQIIKRPDGSQIYGPGKLSAREVQHQLAVRRRAGAIPGKRRSGGKGSRSQIARAAAHA